MDYKFVLLAFLALALVVEALPAKKSKDDEMMDSTETPIADLAVIDTEIKSTTERPPTASKSSPKNATMTEKSEQQNAQPHTVADFIIHPLIAFKPRNPEESVAGKQAGDASSTTPSPWSIFGFNAGQGLGSSVSSLAGSVSGWLNDRIQLPGLVESPIRDPSSTSSTSTTTTQRPDVVVRVQHRPTTRRPLIAINNRNRPANFHNNNNLYSDEYDDEYDEDDVFVNNNNNKRRGNNNNRNKKRRPNQQQQLQEEDSFEEEDNIPIRRPQQNQAPNKRRRRPIVEDDFSEEEEEDDDDGAQSAEQGDNANESESDENIDDEEDDTPQGPNRRRVTAQNNNKRRRQQQQQWQRRKSGNGARRVQKYTESDEAVDDDEGEDEVQFFYGSRPSTKRSQNEANFFQRGQESIINQIRQLTGGRTPAEVGTLVRKTTTTKQTSSKPSKRRQQATILVNRNGQTIYLSPELLSADLPLVNTQVHTAGKFPQPPLSVPLKRKNGPTQYITIPWSQLGISPPDQLHSVTEGVQTQPLILNIPASAIQAMQNQSTKRKNKPVITAEAVPLLAEASIADVFKPATFPNDRHTADVAHKPNAAAAAGMPLIITSKKKSGHKVGSASILPHRIRSGTIVEKAPASAESQKAISDEKSAGEREYLLVGEDSDPGFGRQVQPVHGDARYIWRRRNGRELDAALNVEQQSEVKPLKQPNGEQLIPVQIISEPSMAEQTKADEVKPVLVEKETPQKLPAAAQSESLQKEVPQKATESSNLPANKSEEPMGAA